jgi:hypothetical protein
MQNLVLSVPCITYLVHHTNAYFTKYRSTEGLTKCTNEMFHAADYFINAKNVKSNYSWMGIMMVLYLVLTVLLR